MENIWIHLKIQRKLCCTEGKLNKEEHGVLTGIGINLMHIPTPFTIINQKSQRLPIARWTMKDNKRSTDGPGRHTMTEVALTFFIAGVIDQFRFVLQTGVGFLNYPCDWAIHLTGRLYTLQYTSLLYNNTQMPSHCSHTKEFRNLFGYVSL